MDFLARESSPFSKELWDIIDSTVVSTARKALTGRRFLTLYGPLGAGAQTVPVDSGILSEDVQDGIVKTSGRRFLEVPQLFEDFTLFWRDLEAQAASGYPADLTAVVAAAQAAAKKEDKFIFFGNKELGYEGLLTAQGVNKLKKADWKQGENAFSDVAQAVSLLVDKGLTGRYALVVSPDIYFQLQRIQPGTGVLESERLEKLLDGHLYRSTALGGGKAVLLNTEPQYVDLVVGQDLSTAYLELKDLNHNLRILETLLLRIKRKDAIVVFED